MHMKFSTYTLCCFFLLVLLVVGFCCSATGAITNWPSAQYLMVDQHGSIQPTGYAAGLTEIAQTEAKAAANEAAAQAVVDAAESASNTVNEIVSVLTGSIGFGYVTGYTVGIGGVVQVSTNATAQIVYCQFGSGGSTNIGGVAHTGHYIWHAYSETMNSMPAIKWRTNLMPSNTWEIAEYQATAEYSNTTVNGTLYETVYRSLVYLPSSYNSAFFLAFCEINGGGSAGGRFTVQTGFSIAGKVGFTGDVIENGKCKHYEYGALMTVTNEVPQ